MQLLLAIVSIVPVAIVPGVLCWLMELNRCWTDVDSQPQTAALFHETPGVYLNIKVELI